MQPVLQVRELTVHYSSDRPSETPALEKVTLSLAAGEAVGLLGESGCGKTTLALSVLGLLPPAARVVRGEILLDGSDLLALGEKQLRRIRGAGLSMIFQEPGLALNPFLRVGDQIEEVIRAHRCPGRDSRRREMRSLLEDVGLSDAPRIEAAYPHQLSGGQRQRVVIAQALAGRPALLIADEPTSSLDATVQAEILDLLQSLKERLGIATLLISHNPAVLARLVDRVLVMYAGRIVEQGAAAQVFARPLHPYTRGLLRCLPEPGSQDSSPRGPFPAIPGDPVDLAELPPGCPFAPRCVERMTTCSAREPHAFEPEPFRLVRCFQYGG